MADYRDTKTYVIGIKEKCVSADVVCLSFCTTQGSFDAYAMLGRGMRHGVIMLGGEAGGVLGPGSIYTELADTLYKRGIASLRIDYREPGRCAPCAIDALLAVQYLDDEAVRDIALVGWSFGGAVAIGVAALANSVRGVAAISTVDVADCCIKQLSDKPLLLLHGESDRISPVDVARRVHSEASGPCRLIIYPGTGHELKEARKDVLSDLNDWVCDTLRCNQVAA